MEVVVEMVEAHGSRTVHPKGATGTLTSRMLVAATTTTGSSATKGLMIPAQAPTATTVASATTIISMTSGAAIGTETTRIGGRRGLRMVGGDDTETMGDFLFNYFVVNHFSHTKKNINVVF